MTQDNGVPASPSGASRSAPEAARASSLSGIAWRGVLQMWAGPILTAGVLLIFIFGIGRRFHE